MLLAEFLPCLLSFKVIEYVMQNLLIVQPFCFTKEKWDLLSVKGHNCRNLTKAFQTQPNT